MIYILPGDINVDDNEINTQKSDFKPNSNLKNLMRTSIFLGLFCSRTRETINEEIFQIVVKVQL